MLLDLEVLNGDMTLEFDKYVDYYTINVNKDIESLEIEYECLDNYTINIINNHLDYGINYVYIEVNSDTDSNLYTLEVYRENDTLVFYELEEEVKETIPEYIPYVLVISSLFIIILAFLIIFKKKKS